MCNCAPGRCGGWWSCPCPCHGGPSVVGGSQAGKTTVLLWLADAAQFAREHPNGVVAGEVLESGPVPLAQLTGGDHQHRIAD